MCALPAIGSVHCRCFEHAGVVTREKAMSETPVGLSAQPEGYSDWLSDLKGRIHGAQQRATLAVNRELVLLYWHDPPDTARLGHESD